MQGLVEKFNHTMIKTIRKFCHEDTENWDKWLDYVMLAYRTRVHSVTKVSPYETLFGRRMLEFDTWTEDNFDERSENAVYLRIKQIRNLVESVHPKVKTNIEKMQIRQRKIQNKGARIIEELAVGTLVGIKARGINKKLESRVNGPFEVVEFADNNYQLKDKKGKLLKATFPINHLTLWQ